MKDDFRAAAQRIEANPLGRFSLPQRAQLEEYERATAPWMPAPSLVLLSMTAAPFALGMWRYVRYPELADRIRASLPSDTSYEVETMRRYADLVTDLDHLVAAVGVESEAEPVWLTGEMLAVISSSQTRAALQKARAQRVANELELALPGLDEPPKASMTNATPLVEVLQYAYIDGVHAHFGWQLQGTQFRRAVAYHDPAITGRDDASRRRREDLSREHPEFFALPSVVGSERAGRKEFSHFAPNFVYQYAKAGAMTVGELVAAAREVRESIQSLT